ncbi:rCG56453, isoform CRA_c [Rattus norvegicus]|uniref:RCG56453, isoform CRA_c n=1 Tax=Rattus norvegicus TaxID=10116 RepID=A6IAY3_RAT|nr:rCG56453, isoform CRA_c [Rattus norvegicus]
MGNQEEVITLYTQNVAHLKNHRSLCPDVPSQLMDLPCNSQTQ